MPEPDIHKRGSCPHGVNSIRERHIHIILLERASTSSCKETALTTHKMSEVQASSEKPTKLMQNSI